MITKIKKNWIIILIVIVATFLRLWKLEAIPPHLTPDEAALGYNAYSILKTGRDEYGTFLPLIFKSFGDYKPGLYVYLTVPFVFVLGLNELAVRLPSALFGVLSVYTLYLLVKKLFKNEKLANFSALFLAISPWNIQVSRGAWEVNIALSLTLLGVYIFILSFERIRYLSLSAILFALTLIAYQGAKLSTLIVLLVLILSCYQKIRKTFFGKNTRNLFKSLFIGLVVSLPIILSLFQGKTGRLAVFSVFSYKRPIEFLQAMLDQNNEKIGDVNYLLYHNDFVDEIRGVMGRYFNHFSGRFLFFEGDFANPRHTPPNHGVLLISDILFLVLGIFYIVRKYNKSSNEFRFVIFWLLFSPLPAVLSRDQVHAVRSLAMSIPLLLVASFGVINFTDFVKSKKNYIFYNLATFGLILVTFIYYIDSYFIHLSKHDSKLWEYGYKQVVETVTPIQSKYKIIKVQQSYAQPYIYFLFYTAYDPSKYQAMAKLKESEYGDVGQVESLDNIQFSPIDWSINRGEHGTLFVADSVRIPPTDSSNVEEFNVIKEIKYLNNRDTAFRIVEVK